MPWHWTQFLRITCHTGPSGRSTFGRVAPRLFCAATGTLRDALNAAMRTKRTDHIAAFSKIDFILKFSIKQIRASVPYCHRDCLGGSHKDREGSATCSSTSAHCRERQCDDSL